MVQMNSTPADVLKEMNEITALPLSVNNARELGGLPLMDGRKVKRGLLLSVLGASYKTIVAEYELSNFYFADRVAEVEAQLREKGIEEYLLPYLLGSMAGVHHAMLDA